ncbi:MAG: GTPase RsgA, partial [Solirubrobacterales bacterium]
MPARVIGLHRNHIVDLMTLEGPKLGKPAGRLLQGPIEAASMPAVGDWVAADPEGTVQEILPRRTTLARRADAERERIQVLATNVDVVIVVSSLNKDHDIDRLSRMITLAEGSGARTVIAL